MVQLLIHDSDSANWRRWCEGVGIRYAPQAGVRRYDDYGVVLAAAKAGMGVALARIPLAKTALVDGGLVQVAARQIHVGRAHWVVTRPNEYRASVRRLVERLRDQSEQS
jgi:DNA-binding transcriptional LysR family regulator